MEWIKVEDRLPDVGVEVLVAIESGTRLGYYWRSVQKDRMQFPWEKSPREYNERFCWNYYDDGDHHPCHPTHWMPLPEPPKEEEDGEI